MADVIVSGQTYTGIERVKLRTTDGVLETYGKPILQEKIAIAQGEVTPDEGYDGLSKVTVNVTGVGVWEAMQEGTLTEYIDDVSTEFKGSFYNCTSLEHVSMTKLSSVKNYAFCMCSGLTSVNVPACTRVNNYAFYQCTNLMSIDLPMCTDVREFAFYNCTNLTSVNLPGCTGISLSAFHDCTSLTSIDLPVCTYLDFRAFYNSTNLTSVNLPRCTRINGEVFRGCVALTSIDLPVCTRFYQLAFSNCSSLETMILRNTALATATNSDFLKGTPIESGTGYIYVPSSLVDTYKADSVWSVYANQIRAIEDYPEITGG